MISLIVLTMGINILAIVLCSLAADVDVGGLAADRGREGYPWAALLWICLSGLNGYLLGVNVEALLKALK